MKRFLIPLSILLVIVFLLSGCGTKTTTTTQAPVQTSATSTATTSAPTTSQATTSAATTTSTTTKTTTTAATTTPAATTIVKGGTFTFIHNAGLPTLGSVPEAANSLTLRTTLSVFETLFRVDEKGNIIPWLADSYTISADGKLLTLKLHPGIKFSDGTVFDAAAVQYNLEAILKAGIRGSTVLKKVTSFEIVDPLTLKINLSQYDATLLYRLATTAVGQMGSPTATRKLLPLKIRPKIILLAPGLSCLTAGSGITLLSLRKIPTTGERGNPIWIT